MIRGHYDNYDLYMLLNQKQHHGDKKSTDQYNKPQKPRYRASHIEHVQRDRAAYSELAFWCPNSSSDSTNEARNVTLEKFRYSMNLCVASYRIGPKLLRPRGENRDWILPIKRAHKYPPRVWRCRGSRCERTCIYKRQCTPALFRTPRKPSTLAGQRNIDF